MPAQQRRRTRRTRRTGRTRRRKNRNLFSRKRNNISYRLNYSLKGGGWQSFNEAPHVKQLRAVLWAHASPLATNRAAAQVAIVNGWATKPSWIEQPVWSAVTAENQALMMANALLPPKVEEPPSGEFFGGPHFI